MFDEYFAPCKGIRILESGKNLACRIHWKRLEYSTRNPQSTEWDPESKTVLYSLTWGDSTGLRTASYYFSFIYLPLIRSPHFRTNLKTFVNEISIRRFLPFLLTVSSNREWSALVFTLLGTVWNPRLHLYHSQLIIKVQHQFRIVQLQWK